MNPLKRIWLTLADLLTQVWRLPHSTGLALQQKRERVILDACEEERLDRLRNPSKYLGE
jgi:hypothetical protein